MAETDPVSGNTGSPTTGSPTAESPAAGAPAAGPEPAAAAATSALPTLPHTWRPRKARAASLAIAFAVLAVVGAVAMLLPAAGGRDVGLPDRIGVTMFGVGIAWFLVRHASVHVTARAEGIEVVNLFRRRTVAWGEVLAVTLRRGDPWVTLDLAGGDTLPVMGIQSSDGPAAPAAARQLARLVARESARPAPPA